MAKIYVASSWRNEFQPGVVEGLHTDGHEVYDFKGDADFRWREVDPDWQNWSPGTYLLGLAHPAAERGFGRDMAALVACDICVMVMPCGMSASLVAGWAKGAGKWTAVYVPGLREPDLMVKMADMVSADLFEIRMAIRIVEHRRKVAIGSALA
jgi:hypothetical protein